MKKLLLIFLSVLLLVCAVHADQWCGINNLYFDDARSDITPYGTLNNYASAGNTHFENVTVSPGQAPKYIDGYISQPGYPGVNTLLAGMWEYNIYDMVSSDDVSPHLTFNVSVRHANGTYTILYNATSVQISLGNPAFDVSHIANFNNYTFLSTDRLLVQIYGYTTGSTLKISFINGGVSTSSYIQTGYFSCPSSTSPTNGAESYVYSPTNATPLGEWIVIIIAAFSLLICSFYFRLRNAMGEISTERIVFSISSTVVCGIAAWLSLEVVIPSGTATLVVYQLYIVTVIMVVASVISLANFVYSIIQPEIIKPERKDYNSQKEEERK
jgi:hypothetical protein